MLVVLMGHHLLKKAFAKRLLILLEEYLKILRIKNKILKARDNKKTFATSQGRQMSFSFLFLLHNLEHEKFKVIALVGGPEYWVVGSLSSEFNLAKTLVSGLRCLPYDFYK